IDDDRRLIVGIETRALSIRSFRRGCRVGRSSTSITPREHDRLFDALLVGHRTRTGIVVPSSIESVSADAAASPAVASSAGRFRDPPDTTSITT
ncbi:hypothetical protein HER21_42265, partial [Pseudomonas sp. BGM005]|nr:hypothetical protein [Pseudomonas sp. BG5]